MTEALILRREKFIITNGLGGFIGPQFVGAVSLTLVGPLLTQRRNGCGNFSISLLSRRRSTTHRTLRGLLANTRSDCPRKLHNSLRHVTRLNSTHNLRVVRTRTTHRNVSLFPSVGANSRSTPGGTRSPGRVTIQIFLRRPSLFSTTTSRVTVLATSHLRRCTKQRHNITVSLATRGIRTFQATMTTLFHSTFLKSCYQINSCSSSSRVGLIIDRNSVISAVPIIRNRIRQIVDIHRVSRTILQCSRGANVLQLTHVQGTRRPRVTRLFTSVVLSEPNFFSNSSARSLCALHPMRLTKPDFTFSTTCSPLVSGILVVRTTTSLVTPNGGKCPHIIHALQSQSLNNSTLRRFNDAPISFDKT